MFQDSIKQWQAIYEDFWGSFEYGAWQPWVTAYSTKNFQVPQLELHTNFLDLYMNGAKQFQEMAFAPWLACNRQDSANPLQIALDWQRQWVNMWFESGAGATTTDSSPQRAKVQKTVRDAAPKQAAVQRQIDIDDTAAAANEPLTKDDLKQISGIGPGLEKKLNAKGIISLRQIAALTKKDIDALESDVVRFPGRIERDDWVGQAKRLSGA